ncbi:MAG TPA: hypothetical protein VD908_18545 [Cytophagales bacterium]|nr:hypothetical protein [Cytophagales bacterium]
MEKLNLIELKEYLLKQSVQSDYNFEVSNRTISRDIKDIRALYSIEISYSNKDKTYHINKDEVEFNTHTRLLESLDIINTLQIGGNISPYVYFEKRKPLGTHHFHGPLHAIQQDLVVNFIYQKYWKQETVLKEVEPYALKEAQGRW